MVVVVCRANSAVTRLVYCLKGVALMVVLEVLRGSLLLGTFDPLNLLAILFSAWAAWFLLSRSISR